ncbi:glycosyltransferase family 2 protein [Actinobacillus equuli]|uniref:glycosyltransferase family 2 protein n=1 Tax=Actinobacillus equuli TaxID=718 RepID=UPI0024430D4B|nr:glycosyltransferase family A protein [Actinobacillus equuli]WGE46491.1 glycosyltransferase family 2 protein [Actinobacillus equuli subsp. haemolyticus]
MQKVLTITIPSYNVEAYIAATLDTMVTINNLDLLEILVVNDGSKDNTVAVAQQYVEKNPHSVRIIDKENGGHGSTINAGIREATGKYFKVVDGDDWVDSTALESLLSFLKDHDADLIINPCNQVFMDDNQRKKLLVELSPETKYGEVISYQDALKYMGELQQMHMTTYRTAILKENNIKISEKMFYVDNEYKIYPSIYLNTAIILKDVLYQYRLGREGQSVAPESLIKNRFMLEQVTLNCLTFFSQKSEQMLPLLRDAINLRLNKMIHLRTQAAFLQADLQQAKTELQAFLDKIKQTNLDFYNHISTKLVKLLKFAGFSFFGLVKFLYKNKK